MIGDFADEEGMAVALNIIPELENLVDAGSNEVKGESPKVANRIRWLLSESIVFWAIQ